MGKPKHESGRIRRAGPVAAAGAGAGIEPDNRGGPASLGDPARCLCFNMRKATRAVTQAYDAALRPAGVTAPQFSLLAMLAGHGALTLGDLAARLGMDRTTLTRNLKPLARDGRIAIRAGDDRRERVLELTRPGRRTYEAALPLWLDRQQRLVDAFGAAAAGDLLAGLRRLGVAL